jgi:hypothetical protein
MGDSRGVFHMNRVKDRDGASNVRRWRILLADGGDCGEGRVKRWRLAGGLRSGLTCAEPSKRALDIRPSDGTALVAL